MALSQSLTRAIYGTAAELAAANPVLYKWQFAHATDTGVVKIGNGTTAYNSLAYPFDTIYLKLSGGTLTGNLNGVTPTEIGYLSGATSSLQTQINNINAGLAWKPSVRVATTANITLSGAQTIDGVSVIADDRVLVKDQSTGSQNGIYVCASGAWSRATDASTGGSGSTGILQATVNIQEGTTYADQMWTCSTNAPITIGSTSLTFIKTSNTTYTNGTGLALSGNAFSLATNGTANSHLAQVATATFKGRTTAGTGNVEDLNVTQATAMLNALVGDSGSGGTKGLVPAPASGDAAAGKFLKADSTWAVPPTGGTSLLGQAYYDPGSATTITTTSTTFAAMDTTNLRCAFTAPASGKVIIKYGCWINGTQPTIGFLDGSTVKGCVLLATINGFQMGSKLITGLTPGVSYNYDLAYASSTGGLTTTAKYGGGLTAGNEFGAAFIEAWSA